jgi:VWFA-related protein
MLAFLTLFLGLVTGVQPVQLTVTDPLISKVEIRLDGRTVGVLRGSPWVLTCDFGETLAPHELVAVGFDSDGTVVGEARQWINLPRQRAEVELVPETGADGVARAARLVWSSVDVAQPDEVLLTFNGLPLENARPERFDLPHYDPAVPNLLQARVTLGETEVQTQLVVGGGPGLEAAGELTAIPLYLHEGETLPPVAEMAEWLAKDGEPLKVVAVEQGAADVIMVQDLAWWLQGRLKRLRQEALATRREAQDRPTGLKFQDRFRLLFPIPTVADAASVQSLHFPMSPNLWGGQKEETYSRGATSRQLAEALPQGLIVALPVNGEKKIDTSRQQLTDGVAVAALAAAQGQRGRVVLVVAGSDETDHSRYTPEEVRTYLARLNVPLRVWSPEPDKVPEGWGEVESIANRARLFRAIRELRSFLDRQVVVWVEGRHLPHQVEVTEAAAGRLVPLAAVGPPPPALDEVLDDPLLVAEVPADAAPIPVPPVPPPPAAAAATSTPSGTATAGSQDAPFIDTVEVNVVNVDVVVTGKDGRRVRGLTRDDFLLFEDSEPVEITYFEAPPLIPETAEETGVEVATGTVPTPVVLAEDPRPMSLVIYLDLYHMSPFQRRKTLRELKGYLAAQEGPVRILLATYDGKIEIPLPFTEDPAAVAAALEAIENQKATVLRDPFREAFNEMGEVRSAIDSAHSIPDPDERRMALTAALAQRGTVEGIIRGVALDRMREVRELVESLGRFALGLSGVEGRRAILYVGDRLSLSPGQELYGEAAELMSDTSQLAFEITGVEEGSRQVRLNAEGVAMDLSRDFEKMLRETSATGTTFYTLTPPNLDDSDNTWRTSAGSQGSQGRLASSRNAATKAAACLMSGETGGLCQVGGTEMSLLLADTFQDFGAYYTLAFTPDREPDGKFHKIRVELQAGDRKLQIRYREGYLDRPREDRVRDRVIAALTFGEEQNNLDMQILHGESQPLEQAGLYLVPVEVRVLAQRLALLPQPDSDKRRARARLLVTAMDASGRTTGIQEYPISFEVGEARLATGKPLLYAQKVHLTLAEGPQTLAIGFWDETGRIGSFLREEIVVGTSPRTATATP